MKRSGRSDRSMVLVVDDEPSILESISELLRKDYGVLTTTDPEEALDALVTEDIALILSDQRMPSVSGVDLLARAVRLRPETVRVLLTGYTDVDALIRGVNDGRMYRYVTKPWDPKELLALVAEATTGYGQVVEKRRILDDLRRAADREPLGMQRPPAPVGADPLARENDLLRRALAELETSFWHLRKIEDVLPLCMGCGQVKSETGTWSDLLAFMRKHSSFLSHGYCPACAEKVLADAARYDGGESP